jgi:hypothetical protein
VAGDDVFVDRFGGVVVRSSVEIERLDDGSYSVLWDDGTTTSVPRLLPQRVTRFTRGSVKHRAAVEPEKLQQEFKETPDQVFGAILRENGGPMRSQELTAAAIAAGLDGPTVRAAWPKVRLGWQKNASVRAAGNPPAFSWADTPGVSSQQLSSLPTRRLLEELAAKPGDEQARSTVRLRLRDDGDAADHLAAAALRIIPWPTPPEVAELMREPLAAGALLAPLGDDLLQKIVQGAIAERRRDLVWLLGTAARPAGPVARLSEVLRTDPDADATLTRLLGLLQDGLLGSDPRSERRVAEQVATVVTRLGPLATGPESLAVLFGLLQLAPGESTTLTEAVLRLLPGLPHHVIAAAAQLDDPAAILAAAGAVPLIPGSGRATLLTVAAEAGLPGLTASRTWAGVGIRHLERMLEAGELRAVLSRDDVGAAVVAPLAEAPVREAADRRALAAVLAWPAELLAHVDLPTLARALTAASAHDRTLSRLIEELVESATA